MSNESLIDQKKSSDGSSDKRRKADIASEFNTTQHVVGFGAKKSNKVFSDRGDVDNDD